MRNDANLIIRPIWQEGKDIVTSGNIALQTFIASAKIHLNQLYLQIVALPHRNSFYISQIIHTFHHFTNTVQTCK